MPKFNERLNEALTLRGVTAAELSRRLGVNEGTISNYKKGTYEPKQRRLEQIANVLNVSIAWLMGADVPMIDRQPTPDVFAIPGILPLPRLIPKPRLGTIACGTPIMSEENFDGYDLTPDTIDCDFTLIAQGDSMIGARIHDGDIVYVKHQEVVDNGQIAVIMIDDEKTLKRFYKNGDKVTLLPENPAYEPMVYVGRELENIRILGRAVAFSSYIR